MFPEEGFGCHLKEYCYHSSMDRCSFYVLQVPLEWLSASVEDVLGDLFRRDFLACLRERDLDLVDLDLFLFSPDTD